MGIVSFDLQVECGDEDTLSQVQDQMPKRVKKRRKIQTEDGVRIHSLDKGRMFFNVSVYFLHSNTIVIAPASKQTCGQ